MSYCFLIILMLFDYGLDVKMCLYPTLNRKGSLVAYILAIGGTWGGHHDQLKCYQWLQNRQRHSLSVSVVGHIEPQWLGRYHLTSSFSYCNVRAFCKRSSSKYYGQVQYVRKWNGLVWVSTCQNNFIHSYANSPITNIIGKRSSLILS